MALSNATQIGLGVAAAVAVAMVVVVVGPTLRTRPLVVTDGGYLQDAPDAQGGEKIAVVVPTLDTIRVAPDGAAVLAGRASPLQTVDILLDGTAIARVSADDSGGFVALVTVPFARVSQALTVTGYPSNDAIMSAEVYVIAPFTAPVVVADRPSGQAPLDIATPRPAPAILVASAQGVQVLQSGQPVDVSGVALDSITYDPSGDVLIAGRASGGGAVRVYIDNRSVAVSRIADGGSWRSDLPDIDTGVYTLRIDQIDGYGAVMSRVETPFQREEPQIVAAALAAQTTNPAFQVAVTTVQPGTTLWAIARDQLGEGILYGAVFAANRDRIRDPDLIYPGQVFRLPRGEQ
jgi:nucleoid-associated protein YgaU